MNVLKSIRGKLVLFLFTSLGIVFALSGFLVFSSVFNQSRSDARLYMESLSREYANRLDSILEIPMNMSSSLATAMEAASSVPASSRRKYLLEVLYATLESNDSYFAVWTMWEPDALDNEDTAFRGRDDLGSDADGHYTPYFYRDGKEIKMEASSWEEENQEDFYAIPRDTLRDYLTEPYEYEIDGKTVLMVSTVAPIIKDGRYLGVAGIDIAIEEIDKQLGKVSLYRTGFGRLVSNKGIVVSHPDTSRIGKVAPEWSGPEAERVQNALETGESFTEIAYSESLKRNTLKSFVPIFIGDSPSPWMYGTVVPQEETYENFVKILIFNVLIFGIGFFLIVLIIWIFTGRLLQPLNMTQAALKEISEGDGDLTHRLEIRAHDEIGVLATSFNDFVGKLRAILSSVASELKILRSIGDTLSSDMHGTTSSIVQINGNIESVSKSFAHQGRAVSDVSATVEEIVGNIDSLNRLIDEQGRSLTAGAAAVEQMVANIESITKNIDDGKSSFSKLRDSSDAGYTNLSAVSETISRIATQSDGLEETNSTITAIASQTNLLAMNAAIEAAHAGDAGRGFAVVADEIRKLAEDTAERSGEISQTLDGLRSSIKQAVELSSEAGNAFESIRLSVAEVSDRQEEIRAAVFEQNEGNRVVLENMERLKRIGTEVGSGSTEMTAGSDSILRSIHLLSDITSEMNRAMQEMASGTSEINASVTRVSELSSRTSKGIIAVETAVDRFKF